MSIQVLVSRAAFAAALVAAPTFPAPQASDQRPAVASGPADAATVRARAPLPGDVSRIAVRLAFPATGVSRPADRRRLAVAPAGDPADAGPTR